MRAANSYGEGSADADREIKFPGDGGLLCCGREGVAFAKKKKENTQGNDESKVQVLID